MAHTLSANKRIRQSAKRRERNRNRKKAVRQQIKKVLAVVETGDTATVTTEVNKAVQIMHRTAAQRSLHKNTVARRQSRLAKKLNALKAAKAAPKAG